MSDVYDTIMRGLREVELDVTGQKKLPRETVVADGSVPGKPYKEHIYSELEISEHQIQMDKVRNAREALAEAGEKSRTSDGCDVERDMQQLQGGLGRCYNR